MTSKDFGGDITSFRQRGFDIAGVNLHKSEIDLIVDQETLAKLQGEGYTFARTLSPMAKHGTNPLASYKQPADVETLVKGYATKFPTLAAAESIGKSTQGRDIWALKITKDADRRRTTRRSRSSSTTARTTLVRSCRSRFRSTRSTRS